MNQKIFLLTLLLFGLVIPMTYPSESTFSSSVVVDNNKIETEIVLDFYPRGDKRAVGFKLYGISDYQKLEYEVSYNHDSISEVAMGTKTLSGENAITEEWILLGSCSSGGTCIYHDTNEVSIEVELLDVNLNSKTLSKTISL